MHVRFVTVIGVLALMASVGVPCLGAQEEPVKWSVRQSPAAAVRPGATMTLAVVAAIEGGWHIYSIAQGPGGPAPTTIALPSGQPFVHAGMIRAPAPHRAFDPNFEIETEYDEESTRFDVPVRVAADARTGRHELAVRVRFQACTDTQCLPPATKILTLGINIERAPSSPAVVDGPIAGVEPPASPPADRGAAATITPEPTQPAPAVVADASAGEIRDQARR